MKKLLIHTWTAYKYNNQYYLPYMHWVYLDEIRTYFSEITIIVPVGEIDDPGELILVEMENVNIYRVPFYTNYVGAIKTLFHYLIGYIKLRDYNVAYSRYPAPYGWLQKVFFRSERRIIHFVGDPVDTVINNPNFSYIKKKLWVILFKPENYLFEWACNGAEVYSNGYHIANKLLKKKIEAKPLISSTLRDEDFHLSLLKENIIQPKLIYVGYLRTAKGVETVIHAFILLLKTYPKATLGIVGIGEFQEQLIKIIEENKISKSVKFYGLIEDRLRLNTILRKYDIFCFASLSEGSPRVVLEAMANGINVISTPVGSLPKVFVDNEDLIFAKFNDAADFADKIKNLLCNYETMNYLRKNAFKKVKNYTIKNFIKLIFDEH